MNGAKKRLPSAGKGKRSEILSNQENRPMSNYSATTANDWRSILAGWLCTHGTGAVGRSPPTNTRQRERAYEIRVSTRFMTIQRRLPDIHIRLASHRPTLGFLILKLNVSENGQGVFVHNGSQYSGSDFVLSWATTVSLCRACQHPVSSLGSQAV